MAPPTACRAFRSRAGSVGLGLP